MRWVVAEAAGPEALTYRAPLQGATHIVLPAKAAGVATLAVDVLATADDCRISVGGEGGRKLPGDPLVFATGAECAVQEVPRTPVPSDVKGLKQAGAAASGTGTAPADPA
jgi:hypothetical protein